MINEENTNKSKNLINNFMQMRKSKPSKFYFIIIGVIVGLIILIVIIKCIFKSCKSPYKKNGYIVQQDSDAGGSNKITGSF